jgi:hypothetical protein
MDGLNAVLSVVVLVIPVSMLAAPLVALSLAPRAAAVPLSYALIPVGLLVILLLASIGLYARPTRFELSAEGLRVVWPIRQQRIPLPDIASVEIVSRADFRARYGFGMRVGAGGFLGGFGWLKTTRQTFHLSISRVDSLVLVHLKSSDPWMITPAAPEEFVRALRALLGPRPAPGLIVAQPAGVRGR